MMRSFGLIALLIVLLIVAWLSTRQIAFVSGPGMPPGAAGAASAPANVREQSEQIQQQFKQQLDKAMQTPRDIPDEAR